MSFYHTSYWTDVIQFTCSCKAQSLHTECNITWKHGSIPIKQLNIKNFMKTSLLLAEYKKEPLVKEQKGNRRYAPAFMLWLAVSVTLIELPPICSGALIILAGAPQLLQQPFILTLLLTLLPYPDPTAHEITLQRLSHTVHCRVSDSKSPHYTT